MPNDKMTCDDVMLLATELAMRMDMDVVNPFEGMEPEECAMLGLHFAMALGTSGSIFGMDVEHVANMCINIFTLGWEAQKRYGESATGVDESTESSHLAEGF